MSRLAERVKELGSFGKRAHAYLLQKGAYDIADEHIAQKEGACADQNPQGALRLMNEWATISDVCHGLGRKTAFLLNLLWCTVPQQMVIDDHDLETVCSMCFTEIPVAVARVEKQFNPLYESENKMFPVKTSHPGALRSVNVFFSDVMADVRRHASHVAQSFCSYGKWLHDKGVFNDQACAALLHYCALSGVRRSLAIYALSSVVEPEAAKVLTVVLKTSGMNATQLGAMLCEMNTLCGRGVSQVDWAKDMLYRVDPAGVARKVVAFSDAELADAVDYILDTELGGTKLEFEDADDYWSGRWGWCVNGAHNKFIESVYPEMQAGVDMRMHRRAFMENVQSNPMHVWRGDAYFTTAEKLEHGKSRALYSSDTLTYTVFNHLLGPVERAWKNKRVVLNPGADGLTGMVDRVKREMARSSVSVMIDYEDFNSQHSLKSMALVIDKLCARTGYDTRLRELVVRSFEHSYLVHNGRLIGRFAGTLCSGHRATSFINSVLNCAYLLCVEPRARSMRSIHVGDDVYVGCENVRDAAELLSKVIASDIRVQPLKQSVGRNSAEFLRVAITPACAYGYLARNVASCVSGNWVREGELSKVDQLSTLVAHSWTLRNRSGGQEMGLLLQTCAKRHTGFRGAMLRSLLTHCASINGGPVWGRQTNVRTYNVTEVSYSSLGESMNVERFATNDYLAHHISQVEMQALQMLERYPVNPMVQASYSKSWRTVVGAEQHNDVVITEIVVPVQHKANRVVAEEAEGILLKYPLIVLMKNAFTLEELVGLCRLAGTVVSEHKAREVAFGQRTLGISVATPMVYADIKNQHCRTGYGGVSTYYAYNV